MSISEKEQYDQTQNGRNERPLCERSLYPDKTMMCLDGDTLADNVDIDESTRLTNTYDLTPGQCVQHCLMYSNMSWAVIDGFDQCVCASGIQFDPTIAGAGGRMPLFNCPLSKQQYSGKPCDVKTKVYRVS